VGKSILIPILSGILSVKYVPSRTMLGMVISFGFLLAGAWLPFPQSPAQSHVCYGLSCHGYSPAGTQCSNDGYTGPQFTSAGAKVENRYSVHCNAEWERTTNVSGGSRYAAGSIRWGCANYCLNWSVSSPGLIANGSQVYTLMAAPDIYVPPGAAGKVCINCGKVSTSGPISVPVMSPCTGVS